MRIYVYIYGSVHIYIYYDVISYTNICIYICLSYIIYIYMCISSLEKEAFQRSPSGPEVQQDGAVATVHLLRHVAAHAVEVHEAERG